MPPTKYISAFRLYLFSALFNSDTMSIVVTGATFLEDEKKPLETGLICLPIYL